MLYLFTYLLAIIQCSSVMAIYGYSLLSLPTLFFLVQCAVLQFICRVAESRKLLGGFLIVAHYSIGAFLTPALIRAGVRESEMDFRQWLLTAGDEAESTILFTLFLTLLLPSIFAIFTYYFAVVRFRLSFLMLISIMPCVLYAKTMADVNNTYLVLLGAGTLSVYVLHRRRTLQNKLREMEEEARKLNEYTLGEQANILQASILQQEAAEKQRGNMLPTVAMLFFVLVVMLLAAAIPKQQKAIYYDRFELLFLNELDGTEPENITPDLMEYSGNADNWNESNRQLYLLSGINPTYFKRQNYDSYDFENDHWTRNEFSADPDLTGEEWEEYAKYLNWADFQQAVHFAAEQNSELTTKYHLERFLAAEIVPDPVRMMEVMSMQFGPAYLLTNSRIISASGGLDYHACINGCFVLDRGKHPRSYRYQIRYYDELVYRNAWLEMGATNFLENEDAFLSEVYDEICKAQDEEKAETAAEKYRLLERYRLTLEAFQKQQKLAGIYQELVSDNTAQISDTLREIALAITENCTYDWEKAQALQDYFQKGDFTYDLKYRAPDNSPEYFLTVSKTGTCSDFASAYVLLARAAGMKARYAEGFVPEISSIDDVLYIKESGSHAYPEVYLPNMGWMVFEPTVSSSIEFEQKPSIMDVFRNIRMDYGLIGMLVVFLIGLGLLVFVLRLLIPNIISAWYLLRIATLPEKKAAMLAYKRLQIEAKKHQKKNPRGANDIRTRTPAQWADFFSAQACDTIGWMLLVEQLLCLDEKEAEETTEKVMKTGAKESLYILPIYTRAIRCLRSYSKTEEKRKTVDKRRIKNE